MTHKTGQVRIKIHRHGWMLGKCWGLILTVHTHKLFNGIAWYIYVFTATFDSSDYWHLLLLGLCMCLQKYWSYGVVHRHRGCFSIKTGNLHHPLGYTGSQIKSLQYIPFAPCNSSHKSVHRFCIPKWLLEQQQAVVQDKWGQTHFNFHINHG